MSLRLKKISPGITIQLLLVPVLFLAFFGSETSLSAQLVRKVSLRSEIVAPSPDAEKLLEQMFEKKEQDFFAPAIKEEEEKKDFVEDEERDIIRGAIPRGGSFYIQLKKHGLSETDLYNLIKAIKRVHNISRIPGGTPYELSFIEGEFRGISYEIGRDRIVSAVKNNEKYIAKMAPIEYEIKTVIKGTVIEGNLYDSIVNMGEDPALVYEIEEIFAWDIDFFKDLRKGDKLKLVLEKKYRNGKFSKYGRILGAQLVNQGRIITAIYFPEKKDYFTPEGKSLRKQFLKAPLKYSRISSGFSRKRYHPILKKNVPHLSVDYSAPMGTPVYAVADGVINFAGRQGPSGKLVRIKHNGVYGTAYCHLSGFARGLKRGTFVRQGQLIGRVGMTGRTTGPHLCFHLKKNGIPINPLKFHPPKATPVPRDRWEAFAEVRQEVLQSLASQEIIL